MLKKIIISILIPAFLMQVVGCYSVNEVTKNDATWHNNDIQSVILIDGSKVRFGTDGGKYFFVQGTIEGIDDLGIYNKVLLSNVRDV